jgi:hypothetical protein
MKGTQLGNRLRPDETSVITLDNFRGAGLGSYTVSGTLMYLNNTPIGPGVVVRGQGKTAIEFALTEEIYSSLLRIVNSKESTSEVLFEASRTGESTIPKINYLEFSN